MKKKIQRLKNDLVEITIKVKGNQKKEIDDKPKSLPFFYVGKEMTDQRINTFINDRYPSLCKSIKKHCGKKEDTRSIWYTRDHIAELLEEIDKVKGNGLRMCFGVYEEGHDYAGQLCIVSKVTKEVSNKKGVSFNEDIEMEKQSDFTERLTLWEERQALEDFNFGHPCPPLCGNITGNGG